MNKTLALTKVLLKNGSGSIQNGNKKRINRKYLLAIVMLLAFMPLITSLASFVSMAFDVLSPMEQQGIILAVALPAVAFFVFFFGIMYIINTFYFSMDIESLLHLPLKSTEILSAKFATVLVYEYLTEAIILLPVLGVYGYRNGESPLFYIYGALLFLILPVIPLVAAAIIDMAIMRFTNLAKNKDMYRNVAGVFAIFLALGINLYMQRFSMSASDPQKIMELLSEGNNSMIQVMTSFFPTTKLAVNSIVNSGSISGLQSLILFAASTVIVFAIFLAVGKALYFKGVIGISETSSKRKRLSGEELGKSTRNSPVVISYALKELKLLFRTPVYFLNCIVMNFLLPVFIILPFIVQPDSKDSLEQLLPYLQGQGSGSIVVAVFLAAGIFITASNMITATTISREGKNLFFMKYIPVEYKTQLAAKALSGAVMGFVGVFMLAPLAVFLLKISLFTVIIALAASIPGIMFSAVLGEIIDVAMPKLNWDTEQKAVKQNFNGVIAIFGSLGLSALIIYLCVKLQLGFVPALILLAGMFGVADVILYRILAGYGSKRLAEIDC
ncbi:MAG: transporter [Clostridiaceae bacterium]